MKNNSKENLKWWIAWLDKRFGHRDFSVLNKKFKHALYESCAKEILMTIDIIVEYKIKDSK